MISEIETLISIYISVPVTLRYSAINLVPFTTPPLETVSPTLDETEDGGFQVPLNSTSA